MPSQFLRSYVWVQRQPVMRLAGTTAALTLAATLSAACAGGQTRIYVAPTSETIEAHTEITLSGDGQEVYVLNHSSVPIIVTGLSLVNCENIKNRCEAERLHVRVPPGQRVSLVTVRLNNTSRPSSFDYRYTWEPAKEQ